MTTRRSFIQAITAGGICATMPRILRAEDACTGYAESDFNGSFHTQLRAALIEQEANEATCAKIAKAGFRGVELTSRKITIEKGRIFRANAEKAGIRIHSLMGAGWSDFNNDNPAQRKESIEKMKDRLRVAAACGASTVLCVPGKIGGMKMPKPSEFDITFDSKSLKLLSVVKGDNTPYSAYVAAHNLATERTMEAVREIIPVAAEEGVTLCLENVWNNLWVKPTFMAAMVKSFDSPWVKAYLDLGNHICYAPVEEWLRVEKGIIGKLHIKDFLLDLQKPHEGTFVPIGKGSINWKSVRKVIEEIGYNGWISIESGGFSDTEHRAIMNRFFKGEGA